MSVFGVFLVRMRENTDQKTSRYGHLLRSVIIPISLQIQKQSCGGFFLMVLSKIHKILNISPYTYCFIKKDAPIQLFYCQCCEIFKNNLFFELLHWLLLQISWFQQCSQLQWWFSPKSLPNKFKVVVNELCKW